MPPYELGDPALDRQIRRLVGAAAPEGGGLAARRPPGRGDDRHRPPPAARPGRPGRPAPHQHRHEGDALRLHGLLPLPRTSARWPCSARRALLASDPNYALAEALAAHLAWERGWMVMTGAGPGIMEAANKGAGERSFGINIRLPFEDEANPYVPPERVINFKYFFPRKLTFVKESHAFVLFPGRLRHPRRDPGDPHPDADGQERPAPGGAHGGRRAPATGRSGSTSSAHTLVPPGDDRRRRPGAGPLHPRAWPRRATRSPASTPTTTRSATWTGAWCSACSMPPLPSRWRR